MQRKILAIAILLSTLGASTSTQAADFDRILQLLDNRHCAFCDLKRVNLSGKFLKRAYLRGADLSQTHLAHAYMPKAILIEAQLQDANLVKADLRDADLRGANLQGAILVEADLRNAYLRGATLENADLTGAKVGGAVLDGAIFCNTLMPWGSPSNQNCPTDQPILGDWQERSFACKLVRVFTDFDRSEETWFWTLSQAKSCGESTLVPPDEANEAAAMQKSSSAIPPDEANEAGEAQESSSDSP